MIQKTTFLGISLHTAARRRAVVFGYYVLLLAFAAYPLYRHKFIPAAIIAQTFYLGSMLGGLRSDSIVKPYGEGTIARDPDASRLITLNLTNIRVPSAFREPLDERERTQRDRAHFTAYRVLILTTAGAFLAVFLAFDWAPPLLHGNGPTLLWLLLVYILSLPQSVILWTEPASIPDTTLELVPNH